MEKKKFVRNNKGYMKEIFYLHLVVYILVNLALVYTNLRTNPDYLWFVFPLGGWGIGLVLHFIFARYFWRGKK